MKNKLYLLLISLFIFSNIAFSQYHDAVSNYQRMLEFMEKKQWEMNASLDRLETINALREQLDRLEEQKKLTEEAYDLQKKIQDDLKVLGAVADGGIHSLANAFQTILGRSINPNDYIPNIPATQNLRRALDYEASSYLSNDTKSAHKELFTYSWSDPDNKDGLSLTRHARAFEKVSTELYQVSVGWQDYEDELTAKHILKQNEVLKAIREFSDKIKADIDNSEELQLSNYERLDLLLQYIKLENEANELELSIAKDIRDKIDEQLPNKSEYSDILYKTLTVNIKYAVMKTIKPYNTNQDFSLAKYERDNFKRKK